MPKDILERILANMLKGMLEDMSGRCQKIYQKE